MKKAIWTIIILFILYFGYSNFSIIKHTILKNYTTISDKISKSERMSLTPSTTPLNNDIPREFESTANVNNNNADQSETNMGLFDDVQLSSSDTTETTETIDQEESVTLPEQSEPKEEISNEEKTIVTDLLTALARDGALSNSKQYNVSDRDRQLKQRMDTIKKRFDEKSKEKRLTFQEIKQLKREYNSELEALALKYGLTKAQLEEFAVFIRKYE